MRHDLIPRAGDLRVISRMQKVREFGGCRDLYDQWKEASDRAGLTDLHFHDLRGTAVTMLAEAGCTIPEIAAITGHSLKTVNTILEKYLSRTRALAEAAMEKFENAPATGFANRLQTAVNPKPSKPAK
ncbi:tyrosine-type recombinase/integrase [Bosea sp. (in: a-proteobacteria)]|uniref:tyrosine-type recombinase/integrase n=1 Tax=Bosea sp. (in: a-proteobacteria) TaxID=1871050 RepID=UPI0039C891E1